LARTDLGARALAPAMKSSPMSWFGRDKERERFYLLPGMGGRARRRKELRFLRWSLAAGLVVSAIMACILYLISRGR
jgi:hypothetical protein